MSLNIYPVTDTGICTNEYYEVKINGVEVKLDTARVSANPINRRWPGHQRGEEQTELINFLSFETDERVRFEIKPKHSFEKVFIRPRSLGIVPDISKDGTISFELEKPAYFTVEPFGRSNALHIFADPVKEYDIDIDSKNVIYFGEGEHDAGFIHLESNQTLFIDKGAVVYGCVRAMDAENIKILGRGILDNSKNKEIIHFEANEENNDFAVDNATREHTVQLEYCTNIEIEGITMRDSLVYNIRPVGCENLKISNVKLIGNWRYNSDGIDMHNCVDVFIDNCFIRTYDDCICVKGMDCYYKGDVEKAVHEAMYRNGKAYDVFKNIRIQNCVLWNDWGKCLEIGAETKAEEIYNVVFENCDVIHILFAPLDSYNIDYAHVHDVTYQDIRVEYDDPVPSPFLQKKDSDIYSNLDLSYNPALISVITSVHPEYSVGSTRRGRTSDITFKNIYYYGKNHPKMFFEGYDNEHLTEDVLVENVYWNDSLIKEFPQEHMEIKDFCKNIRYCATADKYKELSKNTVSAKRQLSDSDCVKFENPDGSGLRIMFMGNSITLHGILHEIGWHNMWGMAASAKEKDYVHLVMSEIEKLQSDAAMCICQVSKWERDYRNGKQYYSIFDNARDFEPDIIIMRFVENCPRDNADIAVFKNELDRLMNYINPCGKAKVIMSTGCMRHPLDEAITDYAAEKNYPCVNLGDICDTDEYKALGLFEHQGVANHPGDLGMKVIAERFVEEIKKLI